MKGELLINGKDAWEYWSVRLIDSSYENLLLPPNPKPYVENSFRSMPGKQVFLENPQPQDRDVQLTFGITSTNREDYLNKYELLVKELTSGLVEFEVIPLGKAYKMYVKEDGFISLSTGNDIRMGKLVVRLNEPISEMYGSLPDDPEIPEEPDPELPQYIKYPMETRFFANEKPLNAEGYNLLAKDWDSGKWDDFEKGSLNRGTYHIRRVGEFEWTLENWRMRYRDASYGGGSAYQSYILNQGQIDTAGISATIQEIEMRDGIYAFADQAPPGCPTAYLLNEISVYKDKRAISSINQFDSSFELLDSDVNSSNVIEHNSKVTSMIITYQGGVGATISFKDKPSFRIRRTGAYEDVTVIGTKITVIDDVEFTQASDGRWRATIRWGNYGWRSLVIFDKVFTHEQLLKMEFQIQQGDIANPQYAPSKMDSYCKGWNIPTVADWAQLFGTAGNLDYENVFNNIFSSPSSELPYTGSNIGNDTLGVRITASGHRSNGGSENYGFWDYGNGAYFATLYNPLHDPEKWEIIHPDPNYHAPTIRISRTPVGNKKILVDNGNSSVPEPSASTRYWLRNIRFCRRLTDKELGYRMWKDKANDEILLTDINDSQPVGTTEVPTGILRGLAVRWMNSDKTKVLRSLSWLQAEVDKTKDDGEYGWHGFHSV